MTSTYKKTRVLEPHPGAPHRSSTVLSSARIAVFLENLCCYAHVIEAAKAAGLDRTALHLKKKNDEDFSKAWDEAYMMGMQALEYECQRRAQEGVKKPVFYKGRVVGHERVYSDTLAIFMLKGAMPEKYRERSEVTGKGGGPISFIVENSKDE